MTARILALGGAHLDRIGRIAGDTAPGASNPGSWTEDIGGGSFNVARNLAILGHRVTMVSPRGGDAIGDRVAAAALAAGVDDRPVVFLDRTTPSYSAILEADGNLVIALADMDLYRLFTPRRLRVRALREAFQGADMVVCDANLPAETLLAIARMAEDLAIPVAGIAISPAKVIRFRDCLPHLTYLFMNAAEAAALVGRHASRADEWPALLKGLGLSGAVVTKGGEALAAFSPDTTLTITPPAMTGIVNVTGAGDSLAAGTLEQLLAGAPLADAIRFGIAASRITLRSPLAVAADLDPQAVRHEVRLVGDVKTVF